MRVYLACGVTDMRRGIDGLSTLAEGVIGEVPASGVIFGIRGRRADRIKLLWWDGQGFCLFYKVLERGHFPWPAAKAGVAHLTSAQLSMLVEGIDWRRLRVDLSPVEKRLKTLIEQKDTPKSA